MSNLLVSLGAGLLIIPASWCGFFAGMGLAYYLHQTRQASSWSHEVLFWIGGLSGGTLGLWALSGLGGWPLKAAVAPGGTTPLPWLMAGFGLLLIFRGRVIARLGLEALCHLRPEWGVWGVRWGISALPKKLRGYWLGAGLSAPPFRKNPRGRKLLIEAIDHEHTLRELVKDGHAAGFPRLWHKLGRLARAPTPTSLQLDLIEGASPEQLQTLQPGDLLQLLTAPNPRARKLGMRLSHTLEVDKH